MSSSGARLQSLQQLPTRMFLFIAIKCSLLKYNTYQTRRWTPREWRLRACSTCWQAPFQRRHQFSQNSVWCISVGSPGICHEDMVTGRTFSGPPTASTSLPFPIPSSLIHLQKWTTLCTGAGLIYLNGYSLLFALAALPITRCVIRVAAPMVCTNTLARIIILSQVHAVIALSIRTRRWVSPPNSSPIGSATHYLRRHLQLDALLSSSPSSPTPNCRNSGSGPSSLLTPQ